MKRIILVSVVVSLFIVGLALSPQASRLASSAEQPMGKISGVLLDANDARVANATVKIDSGKVEREVRSGEEGDFDVRLPTGTYQITVEANGFRRFVYSPLKVKADVTEMINIHLEVAVNTQPIPVER